MQLTKARKQLVEDAKAAGYETREGSFSLTVFKANRGNGTITRGITMWDDGTATRCDVPDPTICTTIRTIKAMRQVLDI